MAIALIIPHTQPRMTLREMKLAAECLRLKAALFDCGVKITGLEERNRALAARNAQLTQALHRVHS